MRKLRNRRGETLSETLCAILVVGLAVALLAGLISAASRLDRKAAQADAALYQAVSQAEGAAGSGTPGQITVAIGTGTKTVDVTFYGNKDQAVSYRTLSPTEGTP